MYAAAIKCQLPPVGSPHHGPTMRGSATSGNPPLRPTQHLACCTRTAALTPRLTDPETDAIPTEYRRDTDVEIPAKQRR